MNDNLQNEIFEIENFCKKNSIIFFRGHIEKCKFTNIDWERTSDTGVIDFLGIAKLCGVNILIIDIFKNDLLEEDVKSIATADVDTKRMPNFENSLKSIFQRRGQAVSYSVTFFNSQVAYTFHKTASWAEDYLFINKMIADMQDEIGLLAADQIESYARKIVSQKHYCDERVSASKIQFVRNYLANTELKKTKISTGSSIEHNKSSTRKYFPSKKRNCGKKY